MTTPSGKLAFGQAGVYDALDDRAVIAAVTGYRVGLAGLVRVAAGSGLNIVVSGGWLGVADMGDRTSGVVGSPTDEVVIANPGPPTGSREDVIWVDVDPDEGVWTMVVITAAAAAGRPGLALASVTAPANATLASQMDIRPAAALLERRLLYCGAGTDTRTVTSTTWGAATTPAFCNSTPVLVLPGHWYRVRYWAGSILKASGAGGQIESRIGIGARAGGAPESASAMQVAAAVSFGRQLNAATHGACDFVFRHDPGAAPVFRQYDGRIWNYAGGSTRINFNTGDGPGLVFTVEDLGT